MEDTPCFQYLERRIQVADSAIGYPVAAFCRSAERRWVVWLLTKSWRFEAKAGVGSSHKAIINIYPARRAATPGHVGPQAECAGRDPRRVKPIQTNVPGIQICELFPQIAAMMDKFAVIRSIVGFATATMTAIQCMTGRQQERQRRVAGWPSARWVSQVEGPANQAVPREHGA